MWVEQYRIVRNSLLKWWMIGISNSLDYKVWI